MHKNKSHWWCHTTNLQYNKIKKEWIIIHYITAHKSNHSQTNGKKKNLTFSSATLTHFQITYQLILFNCTLQLMSISNPNKSSLIKVTDTDTDDEYKAFRQYKWQWQNARKPLLGT